MRIGELDDALGREFAARRDAMAGEAARLGARLADGGDAATPPAVRLADTVRISPEARAANFAPRAGALPLAPFPSPVELVATLKEIVAAATPAQATEASARLAALVRRISLAFPGAAPMPASDASDEAAAALVRLALGATSSLNPERIAGLVRQILATMPTIESGAPSGAIAPSSAERAAIAILMAIVRWRGAETQVPLPAPPQQSAGFPAALLGLLAGAIPAKRRTRERQRDEATNPERGRWANLPSSPEDSEGREAAAGAQDDRNH